MKVGEGSKPGRSMTMKRRRRILMMLVVIMMAVIMMMVVLMMMMVAVPGQSKDGGHVVQVAWQDDDGDPGPEVTC